MNVRRFFAPTARDALRKVKDELGGDAIVLANRSVDGGVEIMVLPANALELPSRQAESPAPAQQAGSDAESDFRVSLSASVQKRAQPKQWKPFTPPRVSVPSATPAEVRKPVAESKPAVRPATTRVSAGEPVSVPRASEVQAPAPDPQLMQELLAIRGMIERQLAGFAWGEMSRTAPAKTQLMAELLDAGFSPALARHMTEELRADVDIAEGRDALHRILSRDLVTLSNDDDIIDAGGVYALVGPTGVGKTTTTAKLAARCVVRHGAEKVALLTTDGYRIGAHEQLRIYGRILGVSVHVVRDAADLRQTLKALRDKHMVLIDTVGMSQRDRMVAEQATMLLNAGEVRRLLLVNATSRGDTLDDVVTAYDGPDLAGCVVTKVDEATSLGPVLDVLIRHKLDCYYIANGQRVPEDLHLPNRAYLLHRALKGLAAQSPHRLQTDEAGLLLAASAMAGMGSSAGVPREMRHA
jgi:flagellar biosynthesis protein FlhF